MDKKFRRRLEEEIEGIVALDKIRSRKSWNNRFGGWWKDLWARFAKLAGRYLAVAVLLIFASVTLVGLATGRYGLIVMIAMFEVAWAIILFVAKASVAEGDK